MQHLASTLVCAPRVPSDPATRARLEARGIALEPRADERIEDFEARIETALMVEFQTSGGAQEFQVLYEYSRAVLLAWIGSLLAGQGPSLDPLEVLQDTFVNVYRYAKSFRDGGPRSFRVWSRTIAGNLIRRARGTRRRSLQDLPVGLQEPPDRRAGPEQESQLGEEQRELARAWVILLCAYAKACGELGERDQRALDLIEVRGLPYAQACRMLGVGLSNMKMILFRARRRIRRSMEETLGGGARITVLQPIRRRAS